METLDLTEILKDCPKGTKLYSPLFGEVELLGINDGVAYPIKLRDIEHDVVEFTRYGKYINCEYGECMLFPSKDCRDWGKFKVEQPKPKFEPKQWVLVRNVTIEPWILGIYSHNQGGSDYLYVCAGGSSWRYCIPYEGNEFLIGTSTDLKLTEK